jgi:DNA-binding NarL/FixJ family response regulator
LAFLINGTNGFRCVSAFSSAEDALIEIPEQEVDVVLMDIYLPKMNGLDCTRELLRRKPDLQIIVHTWFEDDALVFAALNRSSTVF